MRIQKKFKVGFVRKKGDVEWKKVEGWLVWKAHSYGRRTHGQLEHPSRSAFGGYHLGRFLCKQRGASKEVQAKRCKQRGASKEVQAKRCKQRGASKEVQAKRCM
jgi:hypothetical protein